jgi:hypothetical protein
MSTELSSLILPLRIGDSPMPLIAVDGGRFAGVQCLEKEAFKNCRLPEEARAGFLLFAGFGRESHSVSQDLSTPEASYWHAIYHRLEPDDWNAKYWFRQAGRHPIEEPLRKSSIEAGWNPGRNWDHARFVEFISAARSGEKPDVRALAIQIQHIEWQLLFDYCAKETKE